MKNTGIFCLILISCILLSFMAGIWLGRNLGASPIRVSNLNTTPETTAPSTAQPEETVTFPININTADAYAFTQLPGIGETLAQRILAFRELNGPFTDTKQLMLVEGIGQATYDKFKDLITTGG